MSPGAPTPWLGALGDTDGTGGAMGSDPSARGSNDPSRRGVVDGPASAVTGAGADGETDPAAPTPSATDGLDEGSDGERDGSDEDAAAATATAGLGDEVSGRLSGADDDSRNSGWWWVPTAALVAGGLWLGLRRRVLLDRED
jgi:hypothetical protein